ncbi:MAG: ubiquitin-like protein Pup [Rothia sp. (in: high G+C Gram-positive bacteria)]|uniref:ubiquitin-like protein Pup n=1 Tax=Rothia sp. (in: high G+C Gram-positive bacteria) TaxID=1885016 RepID=UPI0026DF10D9|nr:ubiquitin-like protein Pup [Rothia sp. (in: high G+C Gram-positive bacteria)]MDO5750622.1 ubiquitin-like protein Pup [Rothia sp. (in: high G+C Gram-positive bacteria)]
MAQERIQQQTSFEQAQAPAEQELTFSNTIAAQDVTDVDDLLDEIDGLLAENAEDFVTGFVQKGGQ